MPKQIAAVQTCRGSHTHTLVIDPKDKANVYIYGSGTGTVRSGEELAGCSGGTRKTIPTRRSSASTSSRCRWRRPKRRASSIGRAFLPTRATGAIAGLWPGGDHGPGTQKTSRRPTNATTSRSFRKSVSRQAPAPGTASCSTSPIPCTRSGWTKSPTTNFAYWHSATFNNDGTKVIFTDEWGGGTRPRCRATDPLNWGADAIFDIVDRKLRFARLLTRCRRRRPNRKTASRTTARSSRCPGRDIMAQAWYQGGVSVFDFTDSAHPVRDRVLRSRADRCQRS